MCGMFGLIRPANVEPGGEIPARAVLTLGTLAEARGIDAAGLACWTGAPGRTEGELPRIAGQPVATLDGWQVHKRLGRFRDLPWRELSGELRSARVVLGHTRYAVQGDPYRLDHAGPLPVESVLGAYTGGVDAAALRRRYRLRRLAGDTDAAVVLAALAGATATPAATPAAGPAADADAAPQVPALLEVLSGLPGPAAAAWVDRGRPGRVWLARGAGSPLAVAFTTGGAALWASDPAWLREVAFSWHLPLAGDGPQELPEGTLLALDLGSPVAVAGRWSFTPAPGTQPRATAPARLVAA